MCIWSPTYQQSVFKRCHSDKHFSDFLPTRWRQKSTGTDVEQDDFTVTLCISDSWHLYTVTRRCVLFHYTSYVLQQAARLSLTDVHARDMLYSELNFICRWFCSFHCILHRQYVTVLFFTRVMFNIHCFGFFLHNQPYPFSVATCLIKEES